MDAGGSGGSGPPMDEAELAAQDYCYVTTTGRSSGRPHTIEIWFALHGDRAYLLSGGGDRSDWVATCERTLRWACGSATGTCWPRLAWSKTPRRMPWLGGWCSTSTFRDTQVNRKSGGARRSRSRSTCRPRSRDLALVEADREQALQVVARVHLERDQCLGPRHAFDLGDPAGDHGGE